MLQQKEDMQKEENTGSREQGTQPEGSRSLLVRRVCDGATAASPGASMTVKGPGASFDGLGCLEIVLKST